LREKNNLKSDARRNGVFGGVMLKFEIRMTEAEPHANCGSAGFSCAKASAFSRMRDMADKMEDKVFFDILQMIDGKRGIMVAAQSLYIRSPLFPRGGAQGLRALSCLEPGRFQRSR
jgi:hypothetical protein